jgi:UDP:flavonoid glycosyltransferase YjiC (YdhE family)
VVSLSTSQQGQADILARIIAALERLRVRAVVTTGPALDPAAFRSSPGVQVVRFAPHARLLRDASLVITHAGLGTVMAALARGVPMLAIPLGRDQFFNAARVEALGAGRCAAADADTTVLAHTVAAALEDTSLRAGAQCMAAAIASYQGGAAAVPALERLVLSAGRPVQGSKPGLAAGTRGAAEPAAPR